MILFLFFKHAITEANDDLVELSGCNIQTFWRFPNVTRCPVRKCPEQFANRKMAKRHYIDVHAKNAILCEICEPNKPIVSPHIICFRHHFQRMHPNKKAPFDLYGKPMASAEPQEIQSRSTRRVSQV